MSFFQTVRLVIRFFRDPALACEALDIVKEMEFFEKEATKLFHLACAAFDDADHAEWKTIVEKRRAAVLRYNQAREKLVKIAFPRGSAGNDER